MPRKKDALETVTTAVKGAAEATVQAATDYVVRPVGQALGLAAPTVPPPKLTRKASQKAAVVRAEDAAAAVKATDRAHRARRRR